MAVRLAIALYHFVMAGLDPATQWPRVRATERLAETPQFH